MSNQGSISSFFSRKNTITICNIWAICARKQGKVTNQRVRIKFDKVVWNCWNILVPTFFSFAAIDRKGDFRKILTGFSSLAAFLGTMPTFLKKSQLPDTEVNAESIGTSFKSQKWESKKLVSPFLTSLFHFETSLIK